MKIAITGGSGLIGSEICNNYEGKHSFVILGRNSFYKQSGKNMVKYIKTDYSVESLKKQLNNVNGLIHLAANRQPSRAQQLSVEDFSTNIKLSANIFEACKARGINNIINASSHYVYGKINKTPYSEDQKVSPDSLYGLSKLSTENLAHYYNTNSKMSIKSLRLSTVFGLRDNDDLFNTFFKKAFHNETIKIYGTGKTQLAYIYVKDVASAIMSTIIHPELKGIINIGNGESISILSLAMSINEVFDNTGNIQFLKHKKSFPSEAIMNIKKSFELLNWEPQWSLSTMLEDIKDEHNKRI